MKFNRTRWSVPVILIFCITALAQAHLPVSGNNYKTTAFATPINTQANLQLIEVLESGKEVIGTVQAATVANDCALGGKQYRIDIVGGDKKLRVVLGGDVNVDLYIRRGTPVAIEDGKIVSDFKSNFSGTTEGLSLPTFRAAPLQAGSYFIAITNCATTAANYKLTATVTDPPDVAILDLFSSAPTGVIVGSIPAPVPGNCEISRTQYRFSEGFDPCGGGLFANVHIHADQKVNVLIRRGKPITVENGVFMYDRMGENQVKVHDLFGFQEAPGSGTFFIAVLNCGFEPVNYTLTAGQAVADVFPPVIFRAFFKKKDLHLEGFFPGSVTVTIDDQPQKIINGGTDPNSVDILIIKKAKKNIAHGQSVKIVATSSGSVCSSSPFLFTRP